MSGGLKGFFIFAFGVCAGATGTYFLLNERFEKKLNDEVYKVKHYYDNATQIDIPKEEPEEEKVVAEPEKPDLFDYARISRQKHKDTAAAETEKESSNFHLVTSERFEELSYEYETQNLICYSDGVVTDTQDNILYNTLDDFVRGATEEDFDNDGWLYVADDAISRLYEVSYDRRTYADVFGTED